MKRKTLAWSLRAIEVIVALIVAAVYGFLIPWMLRGMGSTHPECAGWVGPGIAVLSVTAVPVVIALVCFWIICGNIAADRSFCRQNARLLTVIGVSALADALYCLVIFAALCVIDARPAALAAALCVTLFGLAMAMASFLLSHLVEKASAMEEEIQLTV